MRFQKVLHLQAVVDVLHLISSTRSRQIPVLSPIKSNYRPPLLRRSRIPSSTSRTPGCQFDLPVRRYSVKSGSNKAKFLLIKLRLFQRTLRHQEDRKECPSVSPTTPVSEPTVSVVRASTVMPMSNREGRPGNDHAARYTCDEAIDNDVQVVRDL